MTRRQFITGTAALVAACSVSGTAGKTFDEKLRDEMEFVLKEHAAEEANESTMNFMEAEIDDWAHEYLVSGEIAGFKVKCYFDEARTRYAVCFVKYAGGRGGSKVFEASFAS